MSNHLGTNNFCSYCKGSTEKAGELFRNDKNGRFYGLPVKCVLCAPCIKAKERENNEQ